MLLALQSEYWSKKQSEMKERTIVEFTVALRSIEAKERNALYIVPFLNFLCNFLCFKTKKVEETGIKGLLLRRSDGWQSDTVYKYERAKNYCTGRNRRIEWGSPVVPLPDAVLLSLLSVVLIIFSVVLCGRFRSE